MDTSFTEHVLERARERQKKLAPLREANFVSSSQPNITQSDIVRVRKEVVSDSMLLTPNLTKSNSKTKISSNINASPSTEFNTLNIQKDSLNMEIRFSSTENVRVEVEIQSDDDDQKASVTDVTEQQQSSAESEEEQKCEVAVVLREEAKTRLQRLGKLYSDSQDLSSPISRTEGKFRINDNDEEFKENANTKDVRSQRRGLAKLTDLANTINQWEDESTKNSGYRKASTSQKCKSPAPQPPKVRSHGKPPAPKPPKILTLSPKKPQDVAMKRDKKLHWDKAVLDCLESQGFTRTTSDSRLVYNFKNSQDKSLEENVQTKPKLIAKKFQSKEETLVTPRSPVKSRNIASKAAIFEQNGTSAQMKKDTDPALLSVSQRKALFETNAGVALLPKSAFGISASVKKIQAKKEAENNETTATFKVKESTSIAEKIAQLNQGIICSTIAQKQIEEKIKEERQKEMEVLMNRFNRNVEQTSSNPTIEQDSSDDENCAIVSETTAMIHTKPGGGIVRKSSDMPPQSRRSGDKRPKSDENQVKAILGDVKRIKVRQPKDGKLYPCLSDIEATTETEPETMPSTANNSFTTEESETESENDVDSTLSRDVLQTVCNELNAPKRTSNYGSDCNVANVLAEMEYLNDFDSDEPTPPKHCKLQSPQKSVPLSSESFVYQKFSPNKFRSPCKIITSPSKDIEGLPLSYTVSFYRKQQAQGSTPVKKILRQSAFDESDETIESDLECIEVQEKINKLTQEVNKQQMVISQASSALNLCISTPEFTGSTEQVEAEKLLLLAAHRRQAATIEIQRLKVENSLHPLGQHSQNVAVEKGTLVISNISIPLKKEYTKALAAAGGKGHHVVCLVKCEEQIIDTQLVSTVATSAKNVELTIPGQVKLANVYSDFTATLEVYCLQAQEEILPHEVKYHIGKKNSSKLTPRKTKQDSRLIRPPKESPAGPQAVRTSSFALNGYIIFSIQALNKTQWSLNKMPPISPLEGTVNMRVRCELNVSAEQRGFLNMFEDVSGLGAWHRRWCLLKGSALNYWKYPEDERKKAPIDTIDLKSCITKSVGLVSREICARQHTFLLENERMSQSSDRETLTVSRRGDKTIIKHLLSADTKEERIEWCNNFNKTLNALRMSAHGLP